MPTVEQLFQEKAAYWQQHFTDLDDDDDRFNSNMKKPKAGMTIGTLFASLPNGELLLIE
jgi:hypothetical protein